MSARIAPLEPPYAADLQAVFDRIMPPGVPPLVLFTTLAGDERLYERFRNGGLLDRGHLTLRQREIVIARVTARCGSEYEWGVHTAFFAAKLGFDDARQAALVHGDAENPCWSDDERSLIRACDALLDSATLDDGAWTRIEPLLGAWGVVELVMLVGFYRTVSALTTTLKLPLESFAPRFPPAPAPD